MKLLTVSLILSLCLGLGSTIKCLSCPHAARNNKGLKCIEECDKSIKFCSYKIHDWEKDPERGCAEGKHNFRHCSDKTIIDMLESSNCLWYLSSHSLSRGRGSSPPVQPSITVQLSENFSLRWGGVSFNIS